MKYRQIGAAGPYPSWVRDLTRRSGVYVIREGARCVYVGSSVRNLRATLTRHFQGWRRKKSFWAGFFGGGHDPGLTYDRGAVTVAVRLCPPARARDLEMATIQRLKPRDNLTGQPAEEAPF